jgi:VWFA-related protein
MHFRRTKLALLAATAVLALTPTRALAQVESNVPGAGFDQQTAAPTIQVFSRETVVDVLVTDAKGHPVHGLTKSDFTISEDGNPRPIRSFAEYSKDAPSPPPRNLPPNTYSNADALPASGPVQILYINLPCPPLKPAPAVSYIADYLRTMPTGTQVAIFGFRADIGLRLLQGFTTDGPQAAASIGVDNLNLVLPVCTIPSADPIAAANQIAAYVAGIHGRKNLIWIARPLLPIMRDGGYSWSVGAPPDMIYVHRLMDTYDTFTREQIAVYPFDPRGVPADPQGRPIALNFNSLRVEDIATETGGAAIYNTNDFKGAVAKIVDDTSHFYTLSYIPPRPNDDGHYHSIKIAVDRPGVHLVYRSGYNDEHPAPPDAVLKVHMTQDSMGLGALPATQLAFDLQVTPSPAPAPENSSASRRVLPVPGKSHVAYDILFHLSQTQINFAITPDGMRTASLEFDLAAYDTDAKPVGIRSQTLKLPLTIEEYQEFIQTPFTFYLSIDLPPGPTTLRAGVFDAVSNKSGTLEVPLAVPKPKGAP